MDGGTIVAKDSTISHSRRESNVISRGGVLRLHRCHIHSARGDGVTLWNDTNALLDSNSIYANYGMGVACYDDACAQLTRNRLFDNSAGIFYSTPRVGHTNMVLESNEVE